MPGAMAPVGKLRFLERINSAPKTPSRYIITGTTRDSTGAPLGNCAVELFETQNPSVVRAQTTSDANGLFTVVSTVPPLAFFLVAYLPGSPDVAGTTVNTLTTVPG